MPSTEDLKNRAAARELRKQQREQAVERAQDEAQGASVKQAENQEARARTEAALAERAAAGRPAPVASKPVPRAAKVKAARAASEQQAEKDALRTPAPVDVESEMSKWDGRGTPPLHVLNAMSSSIDTQLRDTGKEIANATAKAAYENFIGKAGRNPGRHSRVRAQMAAGQQQIAVQAARRQED